MRIWFNNHDNLHIYGEQLVKMGWRFDKENGGYVSPDNVVIFVTENEQNKGKAMPFIIDFNKNYKEVKMLINNAIDNLMDINDSHICFCDKRKCPEGAWENKEFRCSDCLLFLSTEFG